MFWPEFKFPPINLWSCPKWRKEMSRYKNDDALDFETIEDEFIDDEINADILKELSEDFYDDEDEIEPDRTWFRDEEAEK